MQIYYFLSINFRFKTLNFNYQYEIFNTCYWFVEKHYYLKSNTKKIKLCMLGHTIWNIFCSDKIY